MAAEASTTQKKGRSLADLLDEQVKSGVVSKEELSKPATWATNNNRRAGGGREFSSFSRSSAQQQYTNDSSSSSLNWQQRELMGGGQQQRRPQANPPARNFSAARDNASDMPEWASADAAPPALATGGGKTSNESLNWQQQSLLNRDDSDPFNRLVRGENEYARE
jgi:hypothetical protein